MRELHFAASALQFEYHAIHFNARMAALTSSTSRWKLLTALPSPAPRVRRLAAGFLRRVLRPTSTSDERQQRQDAAQTGCSEKVVQ
jgi:hypothetical protein